MPDNVLRGSSRALRLLVLSFWHGLCWKGMRFYLAKKNGSIEESLCYANDCVLENKMGVQSVGTFETDSKAWHLHR